MSLKTGAQATTTLGQHKAKKAKAAKSSKPKQHAANTKQPTKKRKRSPPESRVIRKSLFHLKVPLGLGPGQGGGQTMLNWYMRPYKAQPSI